MKTIMVIGAGQMGGGIAQVAAQAGYSVILNDIKEEFVNRGFGIIDKNLNRSIEKGKLKAEEKDLILGRITKSISLQDAVSADLVIEAAIENMGIKAQVFLNWMSYAQSIQFFLLIPLHYQLLRLLLLQNGQIES